LLAAGPDFFIDLLYDARDGAEYLRLDLAEILTNLLEILGIIN